MLHKRVFLSTIFFYHISIREAAGNSCGQFNRFCAIAISRRSDSVG